MLRIFTSVAGLDMPALMAVYEQSNSQKGQTEYPREPAGLQLLFAEQDMRNYLRETFFRTEDAFCAIWEERGKYLAALRVEPYRDGVIVAGLETAPDHRSKGIATQLLTETVEQLRGRKIYSHVAKSNKPSLHVHEKCGFRIIDDRSAFLDGSVSTNSYTLLLEA